MIGRMVKYVRHDETPDYLVLGWLASPALAGTHHGADSVLMVWLCACAAEPQRSAVGKVEAAS